MTENTPPIKLIGFLCNWCSYAGADLAGVSRFQYDASIRIVRLPCSGRMDPLLALKALQDGADGVLVSGCHPGDCHYSDGNYFARRRFAVIHDLMDFVGLDARRLQMSWVSASEGKKWSEVVNGVAQTVREARDEAAAAVQPVAPKFIRPAKTVPVPDEALTNELRQTAAELLQTGRVKAVLGHGLRKGGRPGATIAIITAPDQMDRLSAFRGEAPNLTQHLKGTIEKHGPTAMVGKGTDLLTAANLIREHQLKREDVHLIGVNTGAVAELARGNPRNITGLLQAADSVVGPPPASPAEDEFPDIAAIEAMSRTERAAFWQEQFSSCIRCYACRNACPSCYCKTCFADSRRPTWVNPSPSAESNLFFHLIRAYHMAGRCATCGECERVCPMGLPLLTLARKASQVMRQRFGHEPSADPAIRNPLSSFTQADQVEFIR